MVASWARFKRSECGWTDEWKLMNSVPAPAEMAGITGAEMPSCHTSIDTG